jgi:hypothetical protein
MDLDASLDPRPDRPTAHSRWLLMIEITAMTMTIGVRKFALTAHVTSSVGLLGSIAAFLALAVAGLASQATQAARAAYPAMELIARFVIVPLVFASLLTGLIQSLGTPGVCSGTIGS